MKQIFLVLIPIQFAENRRRQQDADTKANAKVGAEKAKETLPIRKEIAEKGMAARAGIENKEKTIRTY